MFYEPCLDQLLAGKLGAWTSLSARCQFLPSTQYIQKSKSNCVFSRKLKLEEEE